MKTVSITSLLERTSRGGWRKIRHTLPKRSIFPWGRSGKADIRFARLHSFCQCDVIELLIIGLLFELDFGFALVNCPLPFGFGYQRVFPRVDAS